MLHFPEAAGLISVDWASWVELLFSIYLSLSEADSYSWVELIKSECSAWNLKLVTVPILKYGITI